MKPTHKDHTLLRATPKSAGIDVPCPKKVIIPPRQHAVIPLTGNKMMTISNSKNIGLIVNKSSSIIKEFIVYPKINSPSINLKNQFYPMLPKIDTSGPNSITVFNLNKVNELIIEEGQFICQVLIIRNQQEKSKPVVLGKVKVEDKEAFGKLRSALGTHFHIMGKDDTQIGALLPDDTCFILSSKCTCNKSESLSQSLISWNPNNVINGKVCFPGIIDSDYEGCWYSIISSGGVMNKGQEFINECGHAASLNGYLLQVDFNERIILRPVCAHPHQDDSLLKAQMADLDKMPIDFIMDETGYLDRPHSLRGNKSFGAATRLK